MVSIGSFGLTGFFRLDRATVNACVTKASAGAYVLAQHSHRDVFNVLRAGRSDVHVNGRLLSYLSGADYRAEYTAFAFAYAGGKKAAYELECQLYHQFNPPFNELHPDTPNGMRLKCPLCGCCRI